MFESLVITLREGIEAALVVGIILTYLNKTGKVHLKPQVYRGLAAAVAASIAFGFLFRVLGIAPDNPTYEGAVMGVAGLLVATLVIWMWRASRSVKQETEKKLSHVVDHTDHRSRGWGLLAFTFVMVFREGVETVLFLISATLGRLNTVDLVGAAVGIAMAVLFAIFFIRGSLRINLARFFAVTSVVLLLLAFKLLLGSIHGFAEAGLIPLGEEATQTIGVLVEGNISTVILMALLAIPLLAVLWGARTPAPEEKPGETALDHEKHLAARREERVWRLGLIAAAAVILVAMGLTVFGR